MGSTLIGEDKDKLQQLMEAASSKPLCASWINNFDEGKGSCYGLILEALLA